MKACGLCRNQIETDKYFSRKASCPTCGGDLHICLNCRFYSEKAHNSCLEPKSEFQRSRDRANFCDFFSFRVGPPTSAGGPDKNAARKALDELFKK